jgi:hypothetical protein
MIVEWLVPLTLFWVAAAIYLGALSVSVVGGSGLQQVLSLVATLVLYVVLWVVLRWGLGAVGAGALLQLLVPTVLVLAGFPLIARAGFRVLGVRLERGGAPAH